MAKWIDTLPLNELPPGQRRCTDAGGKPVVLFNLDGQVLAIQNICPHAGLPLEDGELRGKVITCPFHGYAYNIENGRNIDFPNEEPPVRTYPTRIENQRIEVNIEP